MSYEIQKVVKQDLTDYVLRRGQSVTYTFSDESLHLNDHHRLYFTCEDRMHFALKDEPQTDKLYMLIDDSLDTEHAATRRFCLNLSCTEPKPYPKRTMTKIMWPPEIDSIMHGATGEWTFGVYAKAEKLKLSEGGFLCIRLERWEKRPDIPAELTREAPDELITIDIPEGTYDYIAFTQTVTIPDTTACLLVIVEGQNYEGRVYLEEPMLTSTAGKNACPDFDLAVPNLERFAWVGQNLSKKEWPEFLITLNGKIIHKGEVFLRIHRYPSVEVEIPDDVILEGENTLTIQYISDYFATVPLSLREVVILERPKKLFHIAYCPRNADFGKDICVLIRTEEENLTLCCESEDFEVVSVLSFATKGIHAARFRAKKFINHQTLTLSCGSVTASAEIVHMVHRGQDNIVCGSADLIYIDNSDQDAVENYLEWFLSKELGDLVTIRPAYRWGGHRTIEPGLWEKFREVCEGMELKYAHITDGRDLPAMFCNPHPNMLAGKNFLGRQLHERDGQIFYWGYPVMETVPTAPVYFDFTQRQGREAPITSENTYLPGNIVVSNDKLSLYRNVNCRQDVKEAYECALDSLRTVRNGNPRHTGPSVMFKYFYEAGFEWLGAETMDSSMEPLLAFHRGSAKAYGQKELGVHQALQWSTHPHDTQPRYRRFLLALYTCYLQGVHQINLEEGFWHLECGFVNHHRFSEATACHRDSEVKLYRFIRSHTRSGEFYTPIAILHGRYDGWKGFGGSELWGIPDMEHGEAENSWSLLRVFYPLSCITQTGMNVPKFSDVPEDNKPRGMYTGTPRGNVDIVPVEKRKYDDYKLLAFLGHNTAERADFDGLYRFVKDGGTLLTTWAHLSYATKLYDIRNHNFKYLYHKLTAPLTTAEPVFEEHIYNGVVVSVAINIPENIKVLEHTDDGIPFVYSVSIGEGSIILFNSTYYPGNNLIRPLYEQILSQQQERIYAEEPSGILCGEDVQYSIYKQENGDYHYYITPVDWYNDPAPNRSAILRVGKDTYGLSVAFGDIIKIVANKTMAAWTDEMNAEVLSIEENTVTVQGVDNVTLHVVYNGREHIYNLDCSRAPVVTVNLV